MAWYLRKALRTGPLRINLSKSGVGLSLGVRGARLGLNRRGAYVHAGRGGLYYRKQLGRRHTNQRHGHTAARPETVDLFADTDALHPGPPLDDSHPPEPQSELGPLGTGGAFVIALLTLPSGWLDALAMLAVALPMGLAVWAVDAAGGAWVRRRLAREAPPPTAARQALPTRRPGKTRSLPARIRAEAALLDWVAAQVAAGIPDTDDAAAEPPALPALARAFGLPLQRAHSLLLAEYRAELRDCLEDHLLAADEEAALEARRHWSGLQPQDLQAELALVASMSEARRVLAGAWSPVDTQAQLVRGEQARHESEARQVVVRVLRRFQRNGVPHRVLGWQIEREGRLLVTDRALRFGDPVPVTRYALADITELELVPEANLIRLSLRNRVSDLAFSTPDAVVVAAHIQAAMAAAQSD